MWATGQHACGASRIACLATESAYWFTVVELADMGDPDVFQPTRAARGAEPLGFIQIDLPCYSCSERRLAAPILAAEPFVDCHPPFPHLLVCHLFLARVRFSIGPTIFGFHALLRRRGWPPNWSPVSTLARSLRKGHQKGLRGGSACPMLGGFFGPPKRSSKGTQMGAQVAPRAAKWGPKWAPKCIPKSTQKHHPGPPGLPPAS